MNAMLAINVHHALSSMSLAVGSFAADNIVARDRGAGIMFATFVNDVHHAVLGVRFAVHRCLASLDIIARVLCAGVMFAPWPRDVHHPVGSMLSAVQRLVATFYIPHRQSRARRVLAAGLHTRLQV